MKSTMVFRTFLKILVSLFFYTSVQATEVKIKPNHPDQYTVKKGDTLWGISAKFLENPWQWMKLWEHNPQISDPDLIYPGNTLYFSMVNGKPQLSLSRNLDSNNSNRSDKGTLKPRVRESSVDEAIKLIPTDAIAQFLTSPKVVDKDTLENSPYVIDFSGEHIIVGAGDTVYVRSITEPESLSYTIYRPGDAFISPENKEILGYEAVYVADATLDKAGDPATLFINRSDREVRTGDRLMVNSENELALNYFPRPPEKEINGSIISVLDGVSQIGQHNIVVLDKGTREGLQAGHTLEIFQRGRIVNDRFSKQKNAAIKLPDEHAGILMVFRSFERVSYALVLEATRPIHVLDIFKSL